MPAKAARAKIAKPIKPEIPGNTGDKIVESLLKVVDAESDTTEDKPDQPVKPSPYPDGTPLFTWEPKAGGEPILLPLSGFERPGKKWLWSMHRQPILTQSWAWMDRAKVPDSVQSRALDLPDDEYLDMFTAWFKALGGGATPGE